MTDTVKENMMISDLANTEKLVPERMRWHQGDPEPEKLGSCLDDDDVKSPLQHTYQQENNETHSQPSQPSQQSQPSSQVELPEEEDRMMAEFNSASPAKQKTMKLDMLRKLVELHKKGVSLSQNYNMESDYRIMKYEYELHDNFRNKNIGIKFMQDACSFITGSLEYANNSYDPFGLKLDGWQNSVDSDPDNTYDIFGGLYDKYGSVGGSSPELRLIQLLTFSAFKVHMAHKMVANQPDLRTMAQNDPNTINQLRAQTIGNRLVEQTKNKEVKYTEKEDEHYKNIVKQSKDYQQLISQEDEFRNRQQQPVMKPLTRRISPRQTSTQPSSVPVDISYQQIQATREISDDQYNRYMMQSVATQRDDLEKKYNEKKEEHEIHDSKQDSLKKPDEVSQHSIKLSNDLDALLHEAEIEIASQTSNTKKSRKRKNKKTLNLDM